jgi:phosphoglycolate phosphatase
MARRLLVMLDVDGTLIDNQGPILASVAHAFARHDLAPPPRDAVLDAVGLSVPEMIEALTPEGAPAGLVHRLIRQYDRHFDALARRGLDDPPFDGAGPFIEAMGARPEVTLALVTGKSRRSLERVLAARGWPGHFAFEATADSAHSKPDPQMLLSTMTRLRFAPRDSLMVGDSRHDMAMARAAGVRAVGVTWGYGRPEALLAEGATRLADSFEAVEAIISEMLR